MRRLINKWLEAKKLAAEKDREQTIALAITLKRIGYKPIYR